MLHWFADYSLYLAKISTFVIAIFILFAGIIAIASRSKEKMQEKLVIKKINDKYEDLEDELRHEILAKDEYKKWHKNEKKLKKEKDKKSEENKTHDKKIFVLNFDGDIKATGVHTLREEITALLTIATSNDEVVVVIDSPGGIVPNYGLAASQLERIRQRNIPLIVAVDRVAASGGYMMACVADRIIAAPFAVIGSIGVVAQLPNFNKLLKKNHIDYEQITAGNYKRTLSLFGEITNDGREKVKEDVEDILFLFKQFIKHHRPHVDVEQVSTGEHWSASRALELNLVDELLTSDDYLFNARKNAEIYELNYIYKKKLGEKIATSIQAGWHKLFQSYSVF